MKVSLSAVCVVIWQHNSPILKQNHVQHVYVIQRKQRVDRCHVRRNRMSRNQRSYCATNRWRKLWLTLQPLRKQTNKQKKSIILPCRWAQHTHSHRSISVCSFTCSCQQHKHPKPPNPVRRRAPAEWLSMKITKHTLSDLIEASGIPATSLFLISSVILQQNFKKFRDGKAVSSNNALYVFDFIIQFTMSILCADSVQPLDINNWI